MAWETLVGAAVTGGFALAAQIIHKLKCIVTPEGCKSGCMDRGIDDTELLLEVVEVNGVQLLYASK